MGRKINVILEIYWDVKKVLMEIRRGIRGQ
jgi:hypothetical protein